MSNLYETSIESNLHKRGSAVETSISMFSQMYHFVAFGLKKARMQFDNGMIVVSIDVDAGSRQLGIINRGKNDSNVHNNYSETYVGDIEQRALPRFIEAFNEVEMPVTFALRGQLTEIDDPLIELLLKSSVKHDIGAHGYYHRNFQVLTREEAQNELYLIDCGMKKFGVRPKSFIFPRNAVRHLDALEEYGYKCYRDDGNFRSDAMFIEKRGNLYNVQPSLYLNQSISPVILEKILDIAVIKKTPLHLWFHPWNFGTTNKQIDRYIDNIFLPFLRYAKIREQKGVLTFETMLSASEKTDLIQKSHPGTLPVTV